MPIGKSIRRYSLFDILPGKTASPVCLAKHGIRVEFRACFEGLEIKTYLIDVRRRYVSRKAHTSVILDIVWQPTH
jgi:hypothetical protein